MANKWNDLANKWHQRCRACGVKKRNAGLRDETCDNEDCDRFGMTLEELYSAFIRETTCPCGGLREASTWLSPLQESMGEDPSPVWRCTECDAITIRKERGYAV